MFLDEYQEESDTPHKTSLSKAPSSLILCCFICTQSCWRHFLCQTPNARCLLHSQKHIVQSLFLFYLCIYLFLSSDLFSQLSSPPHIVPLWSDPLIHSPFSRVCMSKAKGPCRDSPGYSAEDRRREKPSRQDGLLLSKWGWQERGKKGKHSEINTVITTTLMCCNNFPWQKVTYAVAFNDWWHYSVHRYYLYIYSIFYFWIFNLFGNFSLL